MPLVRQPSGGWRAAGSAANMRAGFGLRASLALIACGVAVMAGIVALAIHYLGLRDGLVLAVPCAPLAALFIVPGVVNGVPAFFRLLDHLHWGKWQGRYYEFEGRHIRVSFDDRRRLWMCVRDIERALHIRLQQPTLAQLSFHTRDGLAEFRGNALSEEGVRRLLSGRSERTAVKFSAWFERDVCQPLAKRRELEAKRECRLVDVGWPTLVRPPAAEVEQTDA